MVLLVPAFEMLVGILGQATVLVADAIDFMMICLLSVIAKVETVLVSHKFQTVANHRPLSGKSVT